MNKKIILGIFVATVLGACIVSAASVSSDISSFITGFGEVVKTIFETLLGPGPSGIEGGGLFARVLFLLVVFVIVWAVFRKIPMIEQSGWMIFTLSTAVSLLSTRFLLDAGWVKTVLLPYSVLGIALTAFLPLLIYFYFLEYVVESDTLRRIGWIFAAVVFIGLWWGRYSDIDSNAIYIYPITALICLFFWIFNRPIQEIKETIKINKKKKKKTSVDNNVQITKLTKLLEEYSETLTRLRTQDPPNNTQIANLENKINLVNQQITRLEMEARGIKPNGLMQQITQVITGSGSLGGIKGN